ncbi:ankyrin repeat domain-containing protein [Candidatus Berkiella aquae]|uniref:Ankyrin repeat domain-containing protein n=1 Tax=Candidatus Berkiella aquae TaxID=295108 RepID=A0A0Q9YVX3_9GAMM|nr:ankyrin repeat domain-containing protein [Candidatus Berkiella aquae]MCS5710661.1 ankyrin repeat domain-containing protein [Candidatus Berkiella aquae]
MSEELHDFIAENSDSLQALLPGYDLATLVNQQNSNELKSYLLSGREGMRVIDKIIEPSKNLADAALKKHFLVQMVKKLLPEDWNEIIRDSALIDKYFKNDLQPDWLIECLMSNLPNNNTKIAILTKKVTYQGYDTTLALTDKIPFEKILAIIHSLNDDEKKKVILTQASDFTLLHRAEYDGKLDLLLDSIENPEIKMDLANFLRPFKTRRVSTHFLGLKERGQTFNYQNNQSNKIDSQNFIFSGMRPHEAINVFNESLNDYQPSDDFLTEFDEIKDAFNHIDFYASLGAQVKKHDDYYKKNKFVILPSGWRGHSITIAATNEFLIVGNRGQGLHPKGGCIIYPLVHPLTKEDIKIFCGKSSQQVIEQHIRNIVQKDDIEQPVIFHAFPLKAQKYGTCAIANKKAAIAGLLPLLKAQRSTQVLTAFASDLLNETNQEYKRFTYATRLSRLQELLDELNSDQSNKKMLLEGVIDYCNQHLDFKSELEEKLIQQMVHAVPEASWEDFFKQLSLEAKITIRHLKNCAMGSSLPPFIKALVNKESIIKPEVFASLYEYLEQAHPGEFEAFLSYIVDKRGLRETPLILAVKAGNLDYARKIIQNKTEIESEVYSVALDNAQWDIVKLLIENNIKIDNIVLTKILQSENHEIINNLFTKHPELIKNAMCYAGNCSCDLAAFLLECGADVNASDQSGKTPLMAAIEANNSLLYHFLIANRADINIQTARGTPLRVACNSLTEEHSDIFLHLISQDAKMPPLRRRGRLEIISDVLLHTAIRLNLTHYAQSLIATSDEIITQSSHELPPLMLAIKYNNIELVKSVLERINELCGEDNLDEKIEGMIQDVSDGLPFAIENKHIEIAKLFINMIAGEVVISDRELVAIIEKAIKLKQSDIAIEMLEKFSNIIQSDSAYKEMLNLAIENNAIEVVNKLLEKRDPNTLSWGTYEDPLNAILTQENMDMMQVWFDKFPDSIRNSLLYGSVYKNNDLAMFLIENGANINAVGEERLTPLLLTIIDGNHKFFKELLKRKVNLNQDGFRVSALILALENKRWEMAYLLIREGAHIEVDSDFIKKHLMTIIKEAKLFPNIAISLIAQMSEQDINSIMDEHQSTALLLAAEEGPPSVVRAILAKNPNIDYQNALGNDALMCAVMSNQRNIALDLLRNGAKTVSTNTENKTPLMHVNNLKLAKALIARGVPIEQCDKNGQSAIYYALQNGRVDIISELIEHTTDSYLYDEFSKSSTLNLFNKLPHKAQNAILNSLREKLTDDQLDALKLTNPESKNARNGITSTSGMMRPRS